MTGGWGFPLGVGQYQGINHNISKCWIENTHTNSLCHSLHSLTHSHSHSHTHTKRLFTIRQTKSHSTEHAQKRVQFCGTSVSQKTSGHPITNLWRWQWIKVLEWKHRIVFQILSSCWKGVVCANGDYLFNSKIIQGTKSKPFWFILLWNL